MPKRGGGCRVPRPKPSVTYPLKRQPVTYPLSRSIHVLRRTKIVGYVAKTSLCYIPYVTGYVTDVGPGPCYKPIVLARAHIGIYWGYMVMRLLALGGPFLLPVAVVGVGWDGET